MLYMRKRNWILVIVTIVIIVALIFVITLSNKNKNLGFFSDDSRQVILVKELYENILNENLDTTSLLSKDTSLYINFITYKHKKILTYLIKSMILHSNIILCNFAKI